MHWTLTDVGGDFWRFVRTMDFFGLCSCWLPACSLDDFFLFTLDTFNDLTNAYAFGGNSVGVKKDEISPYAPRITTIQIDPSKIKDIIGSGGKNIRKLTEDNDVKIAIIAVPAETAQEVANALVNAGVQAFLNFSSTVLKTPDNVIVNSVDLALELEHLSYFVK